MASSIDNTKPITGSPTTSSVRANFTAAKSEIEALQSDKANLAGPALTGTTTAVNLTVSGTLNAASVLQVGGVAVTSTAAELNILDGVTATTAELNILDGVTATTAELNTLDGVTATAAELNKVAGVTATAAEINFVDGVTSNIQTQLDDKQTALNAKAPLASPTFTGSFTSPGIDDNASSTTVTLDSSGNFMAGQTTLTGVGGISLKPVAFSGAAQMVFDRSSTTGNSFPLAFQNGGVAVGNIGFSNTVTTYSTSSDVRLKENIVDAPSASEKIDEIQIRSFNWKVDDSFQEYGVIAQEIDSVAPYAVSKGEMWGVDYSKLVPLLIKEVQELRARVAALEGV